MTCSQGNVTLVFLAIIVNKNTAIITNAIISRGVSSRIDNKSCRNLVVVATVVTGFFFQLPFYLFTLRNSHSVGNTGLIVYLFDIFDWQVFYLLLGPIILHTWYLVCSALRLFILLGVFFVYLFDLLTFHDPFDVAKRLFLVELPLAFRRK